MKKAEIFYVHTICIVVVIIVVFAVATTVCLPCNKFAFRILHCFVSFLLPACRFAVIVVLFLLLRASLCALIAGIRRALVFTAL